MCWSIALLELDDVATEFAEDFKHALTLLVSLCQRQPWRVHEGEVIEVGGGALEASVVGGGIGFAVVQEGLDVLQSLLVDDAFYFDRQALHAPWR